MHLVVEGGADKYKPFTRLGFLSEVPFSENGNRFQVVEVQPALQKCAPGRVILARPNSSMKGSRSDR